MKRTHVFLVTAALVLFCGTSSARANWTTLDFPGATSTSIHGIDGDNIVGYYYDGSKGHGFLYDGSTWTTLDYPGAGSSTTSAWGVDGSNIVGYYFNSTSTHGFIYDGTNWTTLDHVGAIRTHVFGIDGFIVVGHH